MIPDPAGDVFAGRIFEALDFVQMMMVELLPERFKGVADFGVINQPPQFLVAFSADVERGFETMSVESIAFMILGEAR